MIILFLASLSLCACEGDYDISFKFTGLTALHGNNANYHVQLSSSDSLDAETYVLFLDLHPIELTRNGRYLDSETPPNVVNGIMEVMITCTKDFDQSHPSGTPLNDLFFAYPKNYFFADSLVNTFGLNMQYAYDFYEEPIPQYMHLLLMASPDTTLNNVQFIAQIVLFDSTIFIDTTESIKLY